MPKVNVILDLDQEFLMENKPVKHNKKSKKIREKTIKINNDLFDLALKKGLRDGTIDVIASDYAPLPRKTGLAGFRTLIPFSYSLVLEGVLTKSQLKERLFLNPKKIIEKGGYKIKI